MGVELPIPLLLLVALGVRLQPFSAFFLIFYTMNLFEKLEKHAAKVFSCSMLD